MINLDRGLSEALRIAGKGQEELWRLFSVYGIWILASIAATLVFVAGINHILAYLIIPVAVTGGVTFFIRYAICRPRPDSNASYVPMLKKWSFPSAHASISFSLSICIAFVVLGISGASYWLIFAPLLMFAGLISISRVILGVHFVSDVIAGALLGSLISLSLIWL